MRTSTNPFVMKLQCLLVRAHNIIWLNALEPVDHSEKMSQEDIDSFMTELEETIDLKDGDDQYSGN